MRIEIPFTKKQLAFLKLIETTPIAAFLGSRGIGKSYSIRNIMLKRRLQYPQSHGAIFRKTYEEVVANHVRPLLEEHPDLRPYYKEGKHLLILPNESTIAFRYCKNEQEVDKYRGQEFHDLAIEEVGDWTETMVNRLRGSNRSSKKGISPRTFMAGNPGGLLHKTLKRWFIERRFKEAERPEDFQAIFASMNENPALMKNDPDYVKRLELETNPTLRKAYLEGSFDLMVGQFFDEIERSVHMVRPFEIPDHWTRFVSYDYGFNHPHALGWFAVDQDGNVYQYREHIQSQWLIEKTAAHFNSFEDADKCRNLIVAGHDCWVKKGVGPTIAEEFGKHKMFLRRANIDRMTGAAQVRNYLSWRDKPNKKPKFFIFETCPISFDCLTRMQHDPNRIEDVLKVDAEQGDPYTGDDSYDMIRMGLMSRPITATAPRKPWRDGYDDFGSSGGEASSWKTA